MSEYIECRTEFRDQDALVQALRDLGYAPAVHEVPVALVDYAGATSEQRRAHVVVPRRQLGVFRVHVSDVDARNAWSPARQGLLRQRYGVAVVKRRASRQGYRVTETVVAGKVKLRLRRYG